MQAYQERTKKNKLCGSHIYYQQKRKEYFKGHLIRAGAIMASALTAAKAAEPEQDTAI